MHFYYKKIIMKKSFIILSLFLVVISSSQCVKEAVVETGAESNFAVTRYSGTIANENNPAVTYSNIETNKQVTAYFNFDQSGEPKQLTHLIMEDNSDLISVLSFDNSGNINKFYQQNLNTGELSQEFLIRSKDNKTYIGDAANTTVYESKSSLNFASVNTSNSVDAIIQKTLKANLIIFQCLDNYAGGSNSRINFIFVAIAVVMVAIATDAHNAIIDIAEEKINQWWEEDLGDCDGNSEGRRAGGVSLVCSESEAVEDEQKKSTDLNVDLCENSLCTIDCNGIENGTSYMDECGDCVGGNTGKQECLLDCAGVDGGSAYKDNCGECVGGNTGETECSENDECKSVCDDYFACLSQVTSADSLNCQPPPQPCNCN